MIHNPQSGGIHLPTLTNPAGAAQILSGYQAINADGEIVTGSIPSQGAQTITPGTSAKTIAAGRYLSGVQTIAGDADLVPGNIKSGVNIFGVSGSYSGKEPVYGIYNDPAQHVNISNSGGDLGSLQITLPETVDRLLGLCVIGWASNGDSVLLCYPASSGYTNFPAFPASPAEDCGWGLYYSGQIETKVETSGAVVTITNNGLTCPALSEIQQVAYTYIPA